MEADLDERKAVYGYLKRKHSLKIEIILKNIKTTFNIFLFIQTITWHHTFTFFFHSSVFCLLPEHSMPFFLIVHDMYLQVGGPNHVYPSQPVNHNTIASLAPLLTGVT